MATTKTGKGRKKTSKKGPGSGGGGDSPIIVGGGGGGKKRGKYIDIWFDHNYYTPNPDELKEYHNKRDELLTLRIKRGQPIDLGQSKNVYIDCFHDTLGNSRIRIKLKPLGVKFEPGEFLYDGVYHHGDDWIIQRVTADRLANPIYVYNPQQGTSDCRVAVNSPMGKRSF